MKIYGLIGYPLTHSFSQTFFTNKFQKENIADCRFDLFPIEQIKAFPLLIGKQNSLKGLAVTIPFKESVIPFLSTLDEVSAKIKAVNCIAFTSQGLKGYNTDVIGFEKSILPLLKPHHKKAIVLGSGGASKAVAFVLQKLNIDYIIVSRNEVKQNKTIRYIDINDLLIQEHQLIINCTPVGQFPFIEESPFITFNAVNKEHLFYDLIYNPAETRFLKLAQSKGASIKNGREMLEIQAEENWKIWNNS